MSSAYKDVQVKPRFTFKRKFKNIEGQPTFEVTPVDEPNVDPTYYRWCQKQILRDIKRDMLYVAEEPLTGIGAHQSVRTQTFELPDGTQVQIGGERVTLMERMFNQEDATEGFTGVQNMVVDSISMTDIDIRKDLFQSVVLAGGNSCFKGF
jgi:actin-related protein